ncbi:hypothetical protein CBL_03090 [Carabus blaptoides fortunei]
MATAAVANVTYDGVHLYVVGTSTPEDNIKKRQRKKLIPLSTQRRLCCESELSTISITKPLYVCVSRDGTFKQPFVVDSSGDLRYPGALGMKSWVPGASSPG